ncbi:hypothetical protein ABW19_dt0205972 [Dactylella cylindrospora]|nr:hypothetical protein ABW19_dt0205972 [Dactylella cylindrospora]
MKLCLDRTTPLTEFDDPELEMEIRDSVRKFKNRNSAEQVTSDYLKELYRFTMNELERKIGKECLRITPIHFWMTKPAIWSDAAENKTMKAAKEAGFGSRPGDEICLILEPEAAALSTITGMSRDYNASAKGGDSIIVCDCGGGTVDLSGYILEEENNRICLRESCPPIGGKCGGTAIDRALRSWLSQRYGESFDTLPLEDTGPGSEFMKSFEWNKEIFGTERGFEEMHLGMDGIETDEFFDEEYDCFTPT